MARIAGRAFGVVTRGELLEAGVTLDEIRHRLRTGALIRIHRGVYRVGHAAPSTDASYLAAVYACGAGAVLGGLAAAWRYETVKGPPPPAEVIASRQRCVPGVRTRRGRLLRGDTATFRDIPRHVNAVLRLRPNTKGAANLRLVLTGDERVALSRLGSAFLARLRAHGLPLPITNRVTSGKRVDCRWPEHALTVELDSFAFHNSRYSGYTWADVLEDPAQMLTELLELLL